MPSGRSRPSAFGMYTLREGFARKRPEWIRACRSRRFPSRSCPYSRHVIPSTPAAAFGRIARYAARRRSGSPWWSSAVNRVSLFCRAVRRTRSNALGASGPALCPGRVSLGHAPFLPHLRSRSRGLVRLDHRYYGHVRLPAFVHPRIAASALPGRSAGHQSGGRTRGLPVLVHGDSVHAMVLRPRGALRKLAHNAPVGVAFHPANCVDTPIALISRLNSPAYTYPCQRFAYALTGADA